MKKTGRYKMMQNHSTDSSDQKRLDLPEYNEDGFCPKCGAGANVDLEHMSTYVYGVSYAVSCPKCGFSFRHFERNTWGEDDRPDVEIIP